MDNLKHIEDLTMTQISETLELLYQSPEELEMELVRLLSKQMEELSKIK